MRYFKSFFMYIVVLFLSTNLFAQTDSLFYKDQLQFHLYGGYSLSYVNFLSTNSAFRWRLDLSLNNKNEHSDDNYRYENASPNQSPNSIQRHVYKDEHNISTLGLNLGVEYLFYMLNKDKVSLFLGFGPYLSVTRYLMTDDYEYTQTNDQTMTHNYSDQNEKSWGLGVRVVVGLQAKISSAISIVGEYGVFVNYSWSGYEFLRESTYSNTFSKTNESRDGKIWEYGVSNLKLGIAYHF